MKIEVSHHTLSRQEIKMGKNKSHSDRFKHIHTYFSIYRHDQGLFRHIQAYSEPYQTSAM